MGFPEIEDDSVNVGWDYVKKKENKETQFFSSTQDDLRFFLFPQFCLYLCLPKGLLILWDNEEGLEEGLKGSHKAYLRG